MRGGETNCENGSKVKHQEGHQGPLRVRSRVLCHHQPHQYRVDTMLSSLSHRQSLNWTADHLPRRVLGCWTMYRSFCDGIVTAAGLCTGPIPVHSCGLQPDGGYVYSLIS